MAGYYWTGEQCCWLYYRNVKGELTCIDGTNWNSYVDLKECDPRAGYIDITGQPHCCPEGTGDEKTHRCECSKGYYFNNLTGECDSQPRFSLSTICNGWNPQGRPGYFFNYLIGKSGLSSYRSTHTCQEVINRMDGGSDILAWNDAACRCECKDPALTFNPGAADECADSGQNCDKVCVDLIDSNVTCPMGQQAYYIKGAWTCCRFYDPDSGTCITTDAQWLQYVKGNQTIFKSGGGYIGPDGLPIDCPTGEIEEGGGVTVVGVNSSTGKCTCSWQHKNGGSVFPGFFDTTTGRCLQQYQLNVFYGNEDPANIPTTGQFFLGNNSSGNNYYKIRSITSTDTTSYVGTEASSPNGFLDYWLHTVFNSNGNYTYTTLPVPSVADTQYIATDSGNVVDAKRSFTVSFYGNNGTPATQTKHFRLPSGWGDVYGTVTTPSRPGYTFVDWYNTSAASGGSTINSTLYTLTSNGSYYARWTANTITLNWDEDGGSAITNGSCTYDGNLTLPAANATTKSGYQLDGWLVNGVLRTAGSTISGGCTHANTGVYSGTSTAIAAQWSAAAPNNVTIMLNNNSASGGSCTTSVQCTPGSSCTLPSWNSSSCNIYKGSKIFIGWATTNNSLTGTYSITAPSSNTTYYAVWKSPTYSVTNGDCSPQDTTTNTPTCDVTCNPGYGTSGTYTGTQGATSFSYTCESSCYQVALSAGDGTGGDSSFYMYRNTADGSSKNCKVYTSSACTTEKTSLSSYPTPPTHHILQGYMRSGINNQYGGSSLVVNSGGGDDFAMLKERCTNGYFHPKNETLTAWYTCATGYHSSNGSCVADTWTVTLNKNASDATAGTASVTVTFDAAMPSMTRPTRSNYNFDGYYDTDAASGGTKYYNADGTSAHVADDLSLTDLYARWTPKTYTITLNNNGGSGGDGSVKEIYDTEWKNSAETQVITSVSLPTKSSSGSNHYVFTGYWSATSGGTNKIPSTGALPAATTFTANTTVYAQFGTCACTPGSNVASCSATGVTDNKCQYTYTCATNYTTGGNSSGTFEGVAGVASNTSSDCTLVSSKTLTLQGYSSTCSITASTYYYVPSTGKWYSDSSLTTEVTGANSDPSCTGYTFRGWYWVNPGNYDDNIGNQAANKGEFVQQNTTIATGQNAPSSVQLYAKNNTNLSSFSIDSNKTLYARWAKNCASVSHGDCDLDVAANGNVTYTGSCDSGYSLSNDGTYQPTCTLDTCNPGYYMNSGSCTACGEGYYCLGGTSTRQACPVNLTTPNNSIAAYHDEAGDCGRRLHLDNDVLWLRSTKKTTKALNFDYFAANGTPVSSGGTPDGAADLFLNLSTTPSPMSSTKNFKMNIGGTIYYGCDDNTCQ